MKTLLFISRIIAGAVFVFSGTVKAIDPLGSTYKFHDYFLAFNLDFLQPMALPLAIMLCLAEFLTGFSLITGFRLRTGIWLSFIMMLFFTPLTLVLAISNPVSDCGCFGDAIHLTNWQTFYKNIFIMIVVLFLFLKGRSASVKYNTIREWIILAGVAFLFLGFTWFNLHYLPVIDFLPFKKGTYIPEKMTIPDNIPVDEYQTTFIYEKDGIKKEFTLDDYPANDSSWKFIDAKTILVKRGYTPPIHDFSIVTPDNTDLTESILSSDRYTLLMIAKKLSETDPQRMKEARNISSFCQQNGINFYLLTSSGTDEIKAFDSGLIICRTDETTLKTIVRSDPGYLLLRKGTIVEKWSRARLPGREWFKKLIENNN